MIIFEQKSEAAELRELELKTADKRSVLKKATRSQRVWGWALLLSIPLGAPALFAMSASATYFLGIPEFVPISISVVAILGGAAVFPHRLYRASYRREELESELNRLELKPLEAWPKSLRK